MSRLTDLKQELIKDIETRYKDGALEYQNAVLLKKLILQAENETDAIAIETLGTMGKRTGFHFDVRLEKIGESIKYKAKNEELSFINDESHLTHELIIGDNYDALLNLLVTHKGKIDIIYIDPPYGEDKMGNSAKTNYDNAISRDNLLSMLYPRLKLAKQLLSEEGAIFCSIDDKNQAYVKGIMDEIFGESNFICQFIRRTRSGGGYGTSDIGVEHDYIICYALNRNNVILNKVLKDDKEIKQYFNNSDEYGLYHKRELKQSDGQEGSRDDRKTMFFPVLFKENIFTLLNKSEMKKIYNEEDKTFNDIQLNKIKEKYIKLGYNFILPVMNNGEYGRWSVALSGMQTLISENNILFVDNKLYKKERVEDSRLFKVKTTLLNDSDYANTIGTDDLKSIFNQSVFDYPKPVNLIKELLKLINKNNAIILDFFAGTGTTGQAVMQLNREDNGNRQFILCTNNEPDKFNTSGIAYDVTSKRLKRVMSGECYDGTSDFKWIQNNSPYMNNLNVYEIKEVSNSAYSVGKTPFDLIDETCYGLNKFKEVKAKIDWVCNNFSDCQKYIEDKEA